MYPSDPLRRLGRRLDADPRPIPQPTDRLAAVLVPLVWGDAPSVVFTQRADELPRHAGEISFPGGLEEPGDAGALGTALREANEELGIDAARVSVLGALTPIHTVVTSILVVPFVGVLDDTAALAPDPGEIAEVLEFPVGALAAAEATVTWQLEDHVYEGYAYEVDGHTIWGATARMLHELLDHLRSEVPWTTHAKPRTSRATPSSAPSSATPT
jgi:8-oxo-dGTP pyrophosphatase MutT (NUDIX family)